MKTFLTALTLLTLILILPSCEDDTIIDDMTPDREKFLGTWNVNENCSKLAYAVEIKSDPSNSTQVIIDGFRHISSCSNPPYAIIAGTSIVIPEQEICSSTFPYIVEGNGKLKNDVIELIYYYKDEADSLNCSAQFVRTK